MSRLFDSPARGGVLVCGSAADWSIPLSSIDTTLSSINSADDSFTSASSSDGYPSSPASAYSPTKGSPLSERSHCDVSIHYLTASFPAHSHTLSHSSSYFASQLPCPPLLSQCKQCDAGTHCLTLPPLLTMHSRLRITEEQLHHFLCQLHFPAHYYCPPLSPPASLDLRTHPPTPLPYAYPPPCQLSRAVEWDGFELRDSLDVEAFLTLAHHFRCTELLARCDAILLHFYSQLPQPVDLWMAWDRLVPAHAFGLAGLRRHCLQRVSRDTRMCGEYEECRAALWRQAGEALYQQLMDEVGDIVLLRAHSRICRKRVATNERGAVC